MPGLDEALSGLLRAALPGLFGGAPPAVRLSTAGDTLAIDQEADGAAGAPAVDDRRDHFAISPAAPAGPYELTQPPYPGPRRVRLTTDAGDRSPLRDDELRWDEADPRRFTLAPRPSRDMAGFSGVEALYGVVAVFTRAKATRTLTLELAATSPDDLARAEALAIAVVSLNREALMAAARAVYEDGDYGADVDVKELRLLRGERVDDRLRLTLQAELELKLRRALDEDEGRPIRRIAGPGAEPGRVVDPRVDVEV